jgi:hypothetical protein
MGTGGSCACHHWTQRAARSSARRTRTRHHHHMVVGALDCATAAWLPHRCVHGVAHPRGLVVAGWHLSGEGTRGPPRRAPGVLVAQPRPASGPPGCARRP